MYILFSLSDILNYILEQHYSAELMHLKESVMSIIQIQNSFEQLKEAQASV